jgi:hypothetical protein
MDSPELRYQNARSTREPLADKLTELQVVEKQRFAARDERGRGYRTTNKYTDAIQHGCGNVPLG